MTECAFTNFDSNYAYVVHLIYSDSKTWAVLTQIKLLLNEAIKFRINNLLLWPLQIWVHVCDSDWGVLCCCHQIPWGNCAWPARHSACTNYLNLEVPGLPRSMIWKSSLLNFFTYFQKFNLNILIFHLGSKTAILKLNLAKMHSKSFFLNGEVCLKVGVQNFLTLIFGSLGTIFGSLWLPDFP